MMRELYKRGHLQSKPKNNVQKGESSTGVKKLTLDGSKEGLFYVPKHYQPGLPSPLAVMLHGSGGDAQHGLSLIKSYADEKNIILLAPVSREYSWDIIARGTFGPDVIYIDQALAQIFEDYTIDTSRLAVGGFSDGASYALSLGLTNGELFTHIMAFSPGFAHAEYITGRPEIFISHGTNDHILPINSCGRKIAKHLQRNGYAPTYQEFEGEHVIPAHISKMAMDWFFKTTSG